MPQRCWTSCSLLFAMGKALKIDRIPKVSLIIVKIDAFVCFLATWATRQNQNIRALVIFLCFTVLITDNPQLLLRRFLQFLSWSFLPKFWRLPKARYQGSSALLVLFFNVRQKFNTCKNLTRKALPCKSLARSALSCKFLARHLCFARFLQEFCNYCITIQLRYSFHGFSIVSP